MYGDSTSLFDKFDVENEIRDLFKARCDLPTGGYIIVQPTEALVSIDVNTGRYTGKKDPEKTILKTNLEAAREIARQIRLRDIGGIIVCDFIDMESRQNRDRVLQELRSHLGRDRARTKAFAVSELGLIEMTRQRVRPSLWHSMTTECPSCAGTGRVFTPEAVARRLERSLKRAGRERRERQIAVRLHPDVALYLLEEEPKLFHTLGKATGLELELRDDPMMRLDEFRLMSRPAGRDVTELVRGSLGGHLVGRRLGGWAARRLGGSAAVASPRSPCPPVRRSGQYVRRSVVRPSPCQNPIPQLELRALYQPLSTTIGTHVRNLPCAR